MEELVSEGPVGLKGGRHFLLLPFSPGLHKKLSLKRKRRKESCIDFASDGNNLLFLPGNVCVDSSVQNSAVINLCQPKRIMIEFGPLMSQRNQ